MTATATAVQELPYLIPQEMQPPMNPILVVDGAGLDKMVRYLTRIATSAQPAFGLDTETDIQVNFLEQRLRTIQTGAKDEQYVIDLLAFAETPENLKGLQGFRKTAKCFEPVVNALRPFLDSNSVLKIGHGLQFEYEMLSWNLGLYTWHLWCTFVVEKVRWAGLQPFKRKGFWGMEHLVERYLRKKMSEESERLQKSFDLCTPLTDEQVLYAAIDTRLPMGVYQGQLQICNSDKLLETALIENDYIPANGDMHINGFKLDRDAWMSLVDEQTKRHTEHVRAMDTYFLPIVGKKNVPAENLLELETKWRALDNRGEEEMSYHTMAKQYGQTGQQKKEWRVKRDALEDQRLLLKKKAGEEYKAASKYATWFKKEGDKMEGEACIAYSSPPQLLEALRKMPGLASKVKEGTLKHVIEDTTDKTLTRMKAEFPVMGAIENYRTTGKAITSFGENILDFINPITGRVHSRHDQLGAVTGRMSSQKPNLQQIPKDPRYRACFIAEPGRKMATLDFDGCIAVGQWVSIGDGWVKIEDHPDAVYKGIKPVVKLCTKRRYSLTCTPDHRIWTPNGWVECQELKAGDWVALQGEQPIAQQERSIHYWLLGFWAGDGCTQTAVGSAGFARKNKEDDGWISKTLETYFGKVPKVYGRTFCLTGERDFMDEVRDYFDKKNLRLPLGSFTNTEIADVLSGLFDSDGSVGLRHVEFSTKYPRFAKDVQEALLVFGVHSRINECIGGRNFVEGGAKYYRVSISDSYSVRQFYKFIGLRLPRKFKKLEELLQTRLHSYDQSNHLPIPCELLRPYGYKKNVFNHLHGRPYTRRKIAEIEDISPAIAEYTAYHWDQVVDISENGEASVYDVLDQPGNRFTASGFVVHNCEVRIMTEASGDPVWIEALNNGWDIHSVVAEKMRSEDWVKATLEACAYVVAHAKCDCPEHKHIRNDSKSINFGLAYGLTAKGLADQLNITEERAQALLNLWHASNPVLSAALTLWGDLAKATCEARDLAGRRRLFRYPSWDWCKEIVTANNKKYKDGKPASEGQIKWKMKSMMESIAREGCNHKIQGTNATATKLSMGCGYDSNGTPFFWHYSRPDKEQAWLVNLVHDEAVFESPDKNITEAYGVAKDCMIRALERYVKKVPVTVDGHVDTHWVK